MPEQTTELTPVMPEVRKAQLDTRRMMVISLWPIYLIFVLVLGVIAVLFWLAWPMVRPVQYIGALLILAIIIFTKPLIRAVVGPNSPLLLSWGDSGLFARDRMARRKFILFLAVFGVVIAFSTFARTTSWFGVFSHGASICCFFLVVSGFVYAWFKTRLWEYLFGGFLVFLIPIAFWCTHAKAGSASHLIIFLLFSALFFLVQGISCFIRWRRWMKSLPETVKAGGE